MPALKLRLIESNALTHAAECLRTLAHPHRLRILQMLLQGDFAVSELAESCKLPSAMAFEHLRLMQRCGFLASEKDGRKVLYRVVEPHLKASSSALGIASGSPRRVGSLHVSPDRSNSSDMSST